MGLSPRYRAIFLAESRGITLEEAILELERTEAAQKRNQSSDPAVLLADAEYTPARRAPDPRDLAAEERRQESIRVGRVAGPPDALTYQGDPNEAPFLTQAKASLGQIFGNLNPEEHPGLFIEQDGRRRALAPNEALTVLSERWKQRADQGTIDESPADFVRSVFGAPKQDRNEATRALGMPDQISRDGAGSALVYGQDDAAHEARFRAKERFSRNERLAAERAEIKPTDNFEYAEALFERGFQRLGAGWNKTAAIVLEELGANEMAGTQRDYAEARDWKAGRKIEGETTGDEVWERPTVGNVARFIRDQGVSSSLDMVVAVAALPAYVASLAGNTAEDRAENNDRARANLLDLVKSLPTSVVSAYLDRAPIEAMLKGSLGRTVLGRVAGGAAAEAGTEAVQTVVESVGSSAGTERGWQRPELKELVLASIAGGGMGAGIAGAVESVKGAANLPERVRAMRSAYGIGDLGDLGDLQLNPLGIREAVHAAPPETALTPGDIASPLPNDLLAQGKRLLEESAADAAANRLLSENGVPGVGQRVRIDFGNRVVEGTVLDGFSTEDPELGTNAGVRIQLADGTLFDEYFGTIRDSGISIEPIAAAPSTPTPAPATPSPTGKPALDRDGAIRFIMNRLEGGAKRVVDTGGVTRYGISKRANPDVDVENLTEDQAVALYRERYWNKLGLDQVADPNYALVAFDAAINQGAGAAQEMMAAAGGDTAKLLALRRQRYADLIARNPGKYGKYEKGWANRLATLESALSGDTVSAGPGTVSSAPGESLPDDLVPDVETPPLAVDPVTVRARDPLPDLTVEESPAAAPAAPAPTIAETPGGKSLRITGASPAQIAAIRAALPEKASLVPSKSGIVTVSKKYEEAVRAAVSDLSPPPVSPLPAGTPPASITPPDGAGGDSAAANPASREGAPFTPNLGGLPEPEAFSLLRENEAAQPLDDLRGNSTNWVMIPHRSGDGATIFHGTDDVARVFTGQGWAQRAHAYAIDNPTPTESPGPVTGGAPAATVPVAGAEPPELKGLDWLVSGLRSIAQDWRAENQAFLDERYGGISADEARARWNTPEDRAAIQKEYAAWTENRASAPAASADSAPPAPEVVSRLQSLISSRSAALNDPAKLARQLGVTPAEANAALGALASRPNPGFRMTKGRPAKTVTIKDARGRPTKRVRQVSPAVPPRYQYETRRRTPMSAMEFVRSIGGINDPRHDLRNVGALARYPGVISRKGRSLDAIGEALWEAGYFPNKNPSDPDQRPTEAETLDFLDGASLKRAYRPDDSPTSQPGEDMSDEEAEFRRLELADLAESGGYTLNDEETDDAMRYVRAGDPVPIALQRALDDAAARSLDALADETGNAEYEAGREAVYEGDIAEQRDSAPEEGLAGSEGVEGDEGGSRAPDAESDGGAEGRGVAAAPAPRGTDLLGEPVDDKPATPAPTPQPTAEPDMFGTREGDERRALERAGEGRLRATTGQKAAGSDGGLFDPASYAPQGDIETAGGDFRDTYTARDAKGRVVGGFPTEAAAKRAAGKGGSTTRNEKAVELVDFDQIVAESQRIGTNVSGDEIYEHPTRGSFTRRVGERRINFGGVAVHYDPEAPDISEEEALGGLSTTSIDQARAAMRQALAALDAAAAPREAAEPEATEERPMLSLSDPTSSPEFKRWFGDSKVVDENGAPLVVYHGTTGDFDSFNRERGNVESDFGAGFYFTSSTEDVAENYAGMGPDLTNKIQREAERIAGEEDLDYSDPEVRERAKQNMGVQHQGATLPVFLSIQNPVIVGGRDETSFTYEEEYDEDADEYGEPTGTLIDFTNSLRLVASRFEDVGEIEDAIAELHWRGREEGDLSVSEIVSFLKESEEGELIYATDENGNMASSEIIRAAFEAMGFDGIIDHSVNEKFGSGRRSGRMMKGMDEGTVHYITFRSNQIKSAVGNRGTWDPADDRINFSLSGSGEEVFYSALERAIEASPTKRASAAQWVATLAKTPGVKREEFEWSGLFDWLNMQTGPVEREALLQVVRDGGIKVEEVVLAPVPDADDIGEDGEQDYEGDGSPQFRDWSSDPSNNTYRELLITLPVGTGGNPDRAPATHWDTEAVVAHARFMEKRDAEGKRVLFIEEVQSDWHQKGRDEGYEQEISAEEKAARQKRLEDAEAGRMAAFNAMAERLHDLGSQAVQKVRGGYSLMTTRPENHLSVEGEARAEVLALIDDWRRAELAKTEAESAAGIDREGRAKGIPEAPFKSSWPALVMKRMIRYAADNGFDRVAWTTGAEQSERYNLSAATGPIRAASWRDAGSYLVQMEDAAKDKLVENGLAERQPRVSARGEAVAMSAAQMKEAFGGDIAARLAERADAAGGRYGEPLEGNDLRVGGEGMKAFYDRNLVNITNDILKKFGVKVGKVEFSTTFAEKWERARGQAVDMTGVGDVTRTWNPGFDITPELREAARGGFPLFNRRNNATARAVERDNRRAGLLARGESPAPKDFAALTATWKPKIEAAMQRLGIEDRVLLNLVGRIDEDPRALGSYWRRTITIALESAPNPVETINHEAIHALRALGAFRPAEWAALVRHVSETRPELLAAAKRKYAGQALNDLQMEEEAIADLYGAWAAGREKAKGFIARAFQRIADLFKTIAAALSSEVQPGQVFRDIDAGRIGRRETGSGANEPSAPRFATNKTIFKVKPPKRLWRGIVEGAQESGAAGLGTFHLGRGLYSAFDKSFARKYAVKRDASGKLVSNGRVIELTPEEAFPRNPLVLNGAGGAGNLFMDWVFRTTSFQRAADFNKAYPDPGVFVREQGYDGVVAGDEVVRYFDEEKPLFSTDAFRRWFGDSKVVDENGAPLVVYHGTGETFDSFERTEDIGFHFGTRDQAEDRASLNFPGPEVMISAYLRIENPLRLPDLHDWTPAAVVSALEDAGILTEEEADAALDEVIDREWAREKLAAKGYDGIVYQNETEGGDETEGAASGDSWIAFESSQIKSTANRGTFDPDDARIMYQMPHTFADPETEKRWKDASKGVGDGPGFIEKHRGWLTEVGQSFTRHWKHLPNIPRYADLQQQFRKLEAAPEAATDEVVRRLTRMVKGLDRASYDLFARKVVLDDLQWEAEAEHKLPFGFTPTTLAEARAEIDALVESNPAVTDAVRHRKLVNKQLADEMIAAGVLTREQIKNPAYYRHMVLQYARAEMAQARKGTNAAGEKIKSPYWAKRMGSTLDINANLLEAEFDWMHKALVDIATARTVEYVKNSDHNIREDLRKKARDANKEAVRELVGDRKAGDAAAQAEAIQKARERGLDMVAKELRAGRVMGIPPHFTTAAAAIENGKVGDEPTAFLAWLADNAKPGAAGAMLVLKADGQGKAWERALLGEKWIDPDDMAGLIKAFDAEGYAPWQPIEGRHFFTAKTIGETALDMFVNRLADSAVPGVNKDELARALGTIRNQLVVGGDRYTMILPEEVADTLNEFGDRRAQGLTARLFGGVQGAWKQWQLINPRRWFKYNLNNMTGDLDAIIAGNPGTFRKVPQAARELYDVWRNQAAPSADYLAAQERGVMSSGMSVQEIPDINRLSAFRQLGEAPSTRPDKLAVAGAAKVWNALQGTTNFREALFRYAAYLDYVEKLRRGDSMEKIGYGASLPRMVDAVAETEDRAALLARDLIGDYGAISVTGGWLRRYLMPFWSWTEINTRRYKRLTVNAYSQGVGRGIATGGGLALAAGAKTSAYLAIRIGAVYGMMTLWNALFFSDEEEELDEMQKRQLHLILGRDSNGEIVTMRLQGALSDVLSLMGFPDAVAAVKKWSNDQGSLGSVLTAMAKAPVNRLASGISPLYTVPGYELPTGQDIWPDLFNPRPIHDRWRHMAGVFTLENEYDLANDLAGNDKPSRGYGRSWREAFVYSRDPGEMAFNEARGIAYDWLETARGREPPAGGGSPTGEALRRYRLSLKYGDEAAANEALDDYEAAGGTGKGLKQSIRMQHPLGPIAKKDRQEFIEQLTEEQYEIFMRAEEYYQRTFIERQTPEQRAATAAEEELEGAQ